MVLQVIVAIVVLVLAVAFVIAGASMESRHRAKRAAEFAEHARSLGLRYSREDNSAPAIDGRFQLAGRTGHDRNAIWGRWRGLPVRYADKTVPVAAGKVIHCSVMRVTLNIAAPYLELSRGRGPSREFRVESQDSMFAAKLMNPAMTAWLRSVSGWVRFELGGDLLMITRDELPDPRPLFDLAAQFVAHIPKTILDQD
jgi:hypothetical protein